MKVADYIAGFLAEKGVTDVFGIPGGVVLDLLYAFEAHGGIVPHLSYHEQCAAFEAGGYAQTSNNIGVAYATRGPGILNTATSVADAYCDSLPILVITAHSGGISNGKIRVMENQEFDLRPIFSTITKCAMRIDRIDDVEIGLQKAYDIAMSERQGPVLIDIATSLLTMEIIPKKVAECKKEANGGWEVAEEIIKAISTSQRPVILAGDGVKQSQTVSELELFAKNNQIPVLSSRYAEDLMPLSDMYYGYIGTHATRYSNFILSKADLIIGLGNRMAFPVKSESFGKLIKNKKILRIDVDPSEFEREIPGTMNYTVGLKHLMPLLKDKKVNYAGMEKWILVCDLLKDKLHEQDINCTIKTVSDILDQIPEEAVITSDVGNNELWLSRAYIDAKIKNRILYSKTFGALGCSIGKAIGAYYACRKPIVCFVGDQGLQLNIQELQLISHEKLPISVVMLNNKASGMIRDGEKRRFGNKYLHTTLNSGYGVPNIASVANAYDIKYFFFHYADVNRRGNIFSEIRGPSLIEIEIEDDNDVLPILKRGEPIQKLFPYIDEDMYEELDRM